MKKHIEQELAGRTIATVVSATRRFVQLLESNGKTHIARARSKAVDAVVGDKVLFEDEGDRAIVVEVLPAKNKLSRSYREETKKLAANLDELFIVTAIGPLFNTYFIDRIMAVAAAEFIPFTLVVNKSDLGAEHFEPLLEIYRRIETPLFCTSAKFGKEMELFEERINNPAIEVAAFCGVSGVGKSTILNYLLPGTRARTDEVSVRTGQGKQTTSQAIGYTLERNSAPRLLLIDLPGVQSFGITHLSKEQVGNAFPEIVTYRQNCAFDNCSHLSEENCGVVRAVENREIPFSRYESYAKMIAELDEARRY